MITLVWLAVGLLLCASELVMPALVSIFLGVSALGVAFLRWIGVLESLPASFGVWVLSSLVMILALRRVATKVLKPDRERANVDEDAQSFGQLVDILVDVGDEEARAGRIRFQGTSWPAISTEGTLKAGTQARIVYRDNLNWVVEAVTETALLDAELESPIPVQSQDVLVGEDKATQ